MVIAIFHHWFQPERLESVVGVGVGVGGNREKNQGTGYAMVPLSFLYFLNPPSFVKFIFDTVKHTVKLNS